MQEQRQARGIRWIDSAVTDFRFGLRHVARKPISALTIVLVLALGIGFNAAIFLLLYSFVNSPPAGTTPDDSQVRIRGINRGIGQLTIGREFSYPEYREYAAQQKLFSSVAAWTSLDVVLDVGGAQERLVSGAATYVTANYFQVLGVRPILGAGLPTDLPDTPPSPPLVAVISHVVWERHFDRAPDIVGRTLKVNGVPVSIAGVAPRRFVGARTGGSQVRVWVPLGARPVLQRGTSFDLGSYDAATFGIVAHLQPEVTPEQTLPTVEAIAARTAREATRMVSGDAGSTDVVPLRADNYFPPSGETPGIAGRVVTLMIPLIILAITCTNVSALQAGLAVARRREIAVRLSLGASRGRVVRQLVTESVLLALAAGALGLFVVWVLWRLFESSIPDLQLVLDWPAFAFTFGIALATGILFGLSPALHATRLAVSEGLKDTASGVVVAARSRLQSGLVIAQIAFTQPALLMMGALILAFASDLRSCRPRSWPTVCSMCASTPTRGTSRSTRSAKTPWTAYRNGSGRCQVSRPSSRRRTTTTSSRWPFTPPTRSAEPRPLVVCSSVLTPRRRDTFRSWAFPSCVDATSTPPIGATDVQWSSAPISRDACGARPIRLGGGS